MLRCCLQFPRLLLIYAGLLFISMLLITMTPPVLFDWSKYEASSPPIEAEHRTEDRHPNISKELTTAKL